MAICDSIPDNVASQIVDRLSVIAMNLRSMRDLSIHAETDVEMVAARIAVAAICERSHLIVDSCAKKLGDMGFGNYDDNDWSDETRELEGGAQ